jgi:3-deoxy-7-phosphoheptulonate synthase
MRVQLPPLGVLRSSQPEYANPALTRTVCVGPALFGGDDPVVIAGPCAVESREQTLAIARAVADAGATVLRGGAFKPRTHPHSFQGLGEEGLAILAEARAETGLPVVTEVMDPRLVETVGAVADMLQIGSRSMQNYALLREVGAYGKPVLLKRGFGNTVEEWIQAAEYLAVEGNHEIVFCERGIRTFADGSYSRSTLDLAAVQAARELTPYPVIVDPTHAAGRSELVPAQAAAGLAAGAHGLIIEVVAEAAHRETALCDGPQAIVPETLRRIVRLAGTLSGAFAGATDTPTPITR